MTSKPKTSRRLWPYLAVPALAVLVAATIYIGDFTAEDVGLGGATTSDDSLPGSQIDASSLAGSDLQPDPAEQHEAAQGKLQGMLQEAVDAHLAELDDENLYASIAVSDGEFELDYNGGEQRDTASIVKVEILGMLLLEYESVDDIPDWVIADAEKMIQESDNDATNNILFGILDGHATMREAHAVFGLDGTEPGEGERWGLTRTTASDQLTMLEGALFEGVLNAEQIELARSLMSELAEFQQWGVVAGAEDGETVWMKNGWDTRDEVGGEWVVNSIGVIAGDTEEPIMLSILTGGSPSEADGIALVEDLAEIARGVVDTDPYA
ncbi:serine hydrolase [Glycomyces tarimensis]